MPLSNASRLADFGTGIGTAGAIIQVDNANQRLGVGTTAPAATLGVAGIVSATAFYGDGSNLDGVASAGLGTALSEEEFNPLTVIYQTSDTLSVGATITVDPPDATTKVAYTQYSEVKLEDDADLIVAEGDDFIPDILGLSTEGSGGGAAYGNNVFNTVYADNIEKADGRGAPNFPKGINVSYTGVSTFTGNVSIGGTLTYEDVTNVDSIGVVTARNGIDVTAGGIDITAGGVTVTAGGINVVAGGIDVGNGNIDSVGEISLDTIKADGVNLAVNCGTDKNVRFAGNIGEIGSVTGFQATNDADSALTDFGIRATSIRLATGGGERLRIGDAGQIGIAGANYGTDGQVLTSKGGSAAVQWADVSGALTRLAGGTVSTSVSEVVVGTSVLTSSHMFYTLRGWLRGSSIRPSLRVYSTSNNWETGDYAYQYWYNVTSTTTKGAEANKSSFLMMHNDPQRNKWEFTVKFSNVHATDYTKLLDCEFSCYDDNLDNDKYLGRQIGGWKGANNAITNLKIEAVAGGNFTSGSWVLHGYN